MYAHTLLLLHPFTIIPLTLCLTLSHITEPLCFWIELGTWQNLDIYIYLSGNLSAENLYLVWSAIRKSNAYNNLHLICDDDVTSLEGKDLSATTKLSILDNSFQFKENDIVIFGLMYPTTKERILVNKVKQAKAKSFIYIADIGADASKLKLLGKDHLPDFILISDQITYRNLVNEGIDKNKLVSVGSLYLDSLFSSNAPAHRTSNNKVGLLSVPNVNDFINWGVSKQYDEVDIAKLIAKQCSQASKQLTIRKHPKELHSNKYNNISNIQVEAAKTSSIVHFLQTCDKVISTYSTSLIIGHRLGKNTASYQPSSELVVREELYNKLGIEIIQRPAELKAFIANPSDSTALLDNHKQVFFNMDNAENYLIEMFKNRYKQGGVYA